MEEVIEYNRAKWKRVGGETFTHYTNGVEVNWHCQTYARVVGSLVPADFGTSPWIPNGHNPPHKGE